MRAIFKQGDQFKQVMEQNKNWEKRKRATNCCQLSFTILIIMGCLSGRGSIHYTGISIDRWLEGMGWWVGEGADTYPGTCWPGNFNKVASLRVSLKKIKPCQARLVHWTKRWPKFNQFCQVTDYFIRNGYRTIKEGLLIITCHFLTSVLGSWFWFRNKKYK